eukprot:TRINITY_DN220_c0_g1_i1.p1 TRINITY_DN220_c0_g1~~TRINITY_DN220_c0_g1_i1.p1  ORF type:complete len:251 (+),score=88.20 TRINITY_DN220_c0_g1_i1:53-805(+)
MATREERRLEKKKAEEAKVAERVRARKKEEDEKKQAYVEKALVVGREVKALVVEMHGDDATWLFEFARFVGLHELIAIKFMEVLCANSITPDLMPYLIKDLSPTQTKPISTSEVLRKHPIHFSEVAYTGEAGSGASRLGKKDNDMRFLSTRDLLVLKKAIKEKKHIDFEIPETTEVDDEEADTDASSNDDAAAADSSDATPVAAADDDDDVKDDASADDDVKDDAAATDSAPAAADLATDADDDVAADSF